MPVHFHEMAPGVWGREIPLEELKQDPVQVVKLALEFGGSNVAARRFIYDLYKVKQTEAVKIEAQLASQA